MVQSTGVEQTPIIMVAPKDGQGKRDARSGGEVLVRQSRDEGSDARQYCTRYIIGVY